MNVTILGSGAFGMALGNCFSKVCQQVTIWSKFEEEILQLRPQYPSFQFSFHLKDAIKGSDIIVVAVPSDYVGEVLSLLKNQYHGQTILIASKGIQNSSYLFFYQLMEDILPNCSYGMISGGTFAKDMMNDCRMGITLATKNETVKKQFQSLFSHHPFLKYDITSDVVGVSICGAIKNVMAIACGILGGLSCSDSTKYLFLADFILETKKLITFLHGDEHTIFCYAGLDDIMMTCHSTQSRNYSFGKMIGQKIDSQIIEEYKNTHTIEGLGTCSSMYHLISSHKELFPFISKVYSILYLHVDSHELLTLI